MKLYTFDQFLEFLLIVNYGVGSVDKLEVMRERIYNCDGIPFDPFYVIDNRDVRKNKSLPFQKLEDYSLMFEDRVFIAGDGSTAYFVNQDDALLFLLASQ
jgi:hypothetical protein